MGLSLVETMGVNCGEDTFGRQRRHSELHGPNVKRTATSAVDILCLVNKTFLHALLQIPDDRANEEAGALHAFGSREKSSDQNIAGGFRHAGRMAVETGPCSSGL